VQQLNHIKDQVESQLGKTVRIKANMGRKRTFHYSGVICGVYSNVFSLSVEKDGAQRILTYSYKDILTKSVQFI